MIAVVAGVTPAGAAAVAARLGAEVPARAAHTCEAVLEAAAGTTDLADELAVPAGRLSKFAVAAVFAGVQKAFVALAEVELCNASMLVQVVAGADAAALGVAATAVSGTAVINAALTAAVISNVLRSLTEENPRSGRSSGVVRTD